MKRNRIRCVFGVWNLVARRRWVVSVAILALASVDSAYSSTGSQLPINVGPITVLVSGNGINVNETGTLPIVIPYSTTDQYCNHDGVLTVVNSSAGISVEAVGSALGPYCDLYIRLRDAEWNLQIPVTGGNSTEILFSFGRVSRAMTNAVVSEASGGVPGSYSSFITQGEVLTGIGRLVLGDLLVPGVDRISQIVPMLTGDIAYFESSQLLGLSYSMTELEGAGSYSETYVLSASVPEQPQATAIPPQVGWLVGGVLIGLGVKMSRRKVRGAS
jgi:hypothetical protein